MHNNATPARLHRGYLCLLPTYLPAIYLLAHLAQPTSPRAKYASVLRRTPSRSLNSANDAERRDQREIDSSIANSLAAKRTSRHETRGLVTQDDRWRPIGTHCEFKQPSDAVLARARLRRRRRAGVSELSLECRECPASVAPATRR